MPRLGHFDAPYIDRNSVDYDIPPASNNGYFANISREKLFRWLYQVKLWRVEVDVSASGTAGSTSKTLDFGAIPINNGNSNQNEGFLAGYVNTILSPSGSDAWIEGGDVQQAFGGGDFEAVSVSFSIQFEIGFKGLFILKDDDGKFRPFMRLFAEAFVHSESNTGEAYELKQILSDNIPPPSSPYDTGIVVQGNESVEIDGIPFDVSNQTVSYVSGTGCSASYTLENIRIIPEEFWSHEGAFNTSTGAWQL